jgi:Domain of unknown function (DUF5642)
VGRLPLGLVILVLVAGCARPVHPVAPQPSPSPAPAAQTEPRPVDPQRIKRIRADLPPGYEVADIDAPTPISGFWGFRPGWAAEPSQCAVLADPVGDPAVPLSAQGLSASGPGGIVYVVVASATSGAVALDPALIADCSRWTLGNGRSSATVNLVAAPAVDGADTVGMAAEIRTVVESGTETDSRAQTYSAYLGEHFVFVTVVTDPGSPDPPLPPEFAADLLVKTVTALRG